MHATPRWTRRWRTLVVGCVAAFVNGMSTASVVAQAAPGASWHDERADSLVARAIARRSLQLADSTLLGYHANAHGFLAFLAQLGEGTFIPPKVVQTEELAVSVTWWQPAQSAQRLVGRRDTTLLPADVGYYRDRYAVVLDNLPDRIRLGDGFDVADVPHPLAADAASRYEYRRGGRFDIRIPGRSITVDEVEFRPRDQSKASAVGSVYLDRETGAVVRLSMTFTRAAILDKRIETLVVTLENGLVNTRYWLPRRQEVEVSRKSTWLDIPVRGIVRGHWEISDYDVNEQTPAAVKLLPRWSSVSRDSLEHHHFDGAITDVLPPDMRLASDADVEQARKMAESAVRAAALTGSSRSSAYGRGISDALRFSRTEGVALGAGVSRRFGNAWQSTLAARYGISDQQVKGRFTIGRTPPLGGAPLAQLFIEREYRDVATPERSGVANSLGALLGSDFTTQVDTRAAGFVIRPSSSSAWTYRVAAERDDPLAVHATPITGAYLPALSAWRTRGGRIEARGAGASFASERPLNRRLWALDFSAGAARADTGATDRATPVVARATATLTFERALSHERLLVLQTLAGGTVGHDVPPQWLVFAGGPQSAPGYRWSSLAGKIIASERVEFRQPVPAPAIPLGKYGRAPARVVFAPYVQATVLGAHARGISADVDGIYPSVGVGMLFFFDLIRLDAARDLRHGRWSFGLDIDRGFWGVL
jgi:hypothetical protein